MRFSHVLVESSVLQTVDKLRIPRVPLMSSLKHVICSRRRVLSSSGWYISTTSPIFASGWSFGFSNRSSAEIEINEIIVSSDLIVTPSEFESLQLNTYRWSSFDACTIWTISFWLFAWCVPIDWAMFCSAGQQTSNFIISYNFVQNWFSYDSTRKQSE